MEQKKNNQTQVNPKELFDENGKLRPIKKKTVEKLPKEKPTCKKLEKEITAERFLEQLQSQLGVKSKWDGYEHIIKTSGKDGRVCAWVCDRQQYISLSLFPPFNEKWKTIRISNLTEADNAIIMLKAKINGYSPKK